jgi:hypothetical protein
MPTTPDPIQAPSAAPTHHLKLWSDGKRIYCEIPGIADKPAYITTFDFDSRGTALALSLLGLHRINYDYAGTIPYGYTGRSNFTHGDEAQQALAEKILREAGLIK